MKVPSALTPVDNVTAERLKRDFVCAGCWHSLYVVFAPKRKYVVKCGVCEDETPGYASKYWVEKRVNESIFKLREVKRGYPELFRGEDGEDMSVEEIIEALTCGG
jgi:hypothetical protein